MGSWIAAPLTRKMSSKPSPSKSSGTRAAWAAVAAARAAYVAGFATSPDDPGVGPLFRAADPGNRNNTLSKFSSQLASVPLWFHPGEKWRYGISVDVQAAQQCRPVVPPRLVGPRVFRLVAGGLDCLPNVLRTFTRSGFAEIA